MAESHLFDPINNKGNNFEFGKEQIELKIEEFTEIGGSPIQGITLRKILHGHTDIINRLAWSPDGRYLASPSYDKTIRVWDNEGGENVLILEGHTTNAIAVEWAPDGQSIISRSSNEVFVWNVKIKQPIHHLLLDDPVEDISLSPDGKYLAIGTVGGSLQLRDNQTWAIQKNFYGINSSILCLNWSHDGYFLVTAAKDDAIKLWEANSGRLVRSFEGHEKDVNNVLWLPNSNNFILSSSLDHTIRIWNISTGRQTSILEGHTAEIIRIAVSFDGRLLASTSKDNTMIFWRTDNWSQVARIYEFSGNWESGLTFNPKNYKLATLGDQATSIRIWDIDYDFFIRNELAFKPVRYTTAKIVLVGDSGVGKTGLGWRIAHNEFKEHPSTHGQQFWVIPELGIKRQDGTECEAVLWDLAGQHNYRSIHSIFLDDVDASLILFDASNRQDPLKGVEFWLNELTGKKKLPPTVLVGARSDVSPTRLSLSELKQFCQQHGISGGYVSVSAKNGDGLNILLGTLRRQIPWDHMTTTVTNVTFKRIKDFVLSLKERLSSNDLMSQKDILIRVSELREQLQRTDNEWNFSNGEMITAVGHLQTHGYVSILKSSAGDEFILLTPNLLANLASSIVSLADKNPREVVAINETILLQSKFQFEELKDLGKSEQQILLDAAILRFLEHSICFRETLGSETLLIFPGLMKQKRPLTNDLDTVDDMSYIVRGRVENIYASLVVLLGYTPSFTRINQWQNQAQYEINPGEICGFRLIEERAGELEFVVYYSTNMPNHGRQIFQGLFEKFLTQRDISLTRFPPVSCSNNHLQQRVTVMSMIQDGEKFMFCAKCGKEIQLPELDKPLTIGARILSQVNEEDAFARLRNKYETFLAQIKSFRSDRSSPRCYISYPDGDLKWSENLIHNLQDAGVIILYDRAQVQKDDFVLVLGTTNYLSDLEKSIERITQDIPLIYSKIPKSPEDKSMLAPLLVEGNVFTAFPHEIRNCIPADFRIDSRYVICLFDLILKLYNIPYTQPVFEHLRTTLQTQWERTINRIKGLPQQGVYLSYAWGEESEVIANQIDSAFQERSISILRDKRYVGYKDHIKAFMETKGKGKAIILLLSEKYLKSENCLFELLQIAKHGNFEGRIFPILLEDAQIYTAKDRIRYVQFWEKQLKELDNAMKTVSATNMQGFREDIDLYAEIRANLPRLTDILKDMNTLTPSIHRDADFQTLFDAVMAKLEE